MKFLIGPIFTLAAVVVLVPISLQADTEEKMIIALKSDSHEMVKTDVSDLVVGEAKTIETGDGKIIDILRTADGVELYVDGELLDMDLEGHGDNDHHMMTKRVEIVCENGEECEETEIIHSGEHGGELTWIDADNVNVIIDKEVEFSCGDNDETSCEDKLVWVSEGDDIDLEEIHELHQGDKEHKVMVIRKKVVTDD